MRWKTLTYHLTFFCYFSTILSTAFFAYIYLIIPVLTVQISLQYSRNWDHVTLRIILLGAFYLHEDVYQYQFPVTGDGPVRVFSAKHAQTTHHRCGGWEAWVAPARFAPLQSSLQRRYNCPHLMALLWQCTDFPFLVKQSGDYLPEHIRYCCWRSTCRTSLENTRYISFILSSIICFLGSAEVQYCHLKEQVSYRANHGGCPN